MYDRFVQLVNEKGVTAYKVAKATGIPASTFSDWKKGKSEPKAEKLHKIADYFNVSVDYLIGNGYVHMCPGCGLQYNLLDKQQVESHKQRHAKWEKAKEEFNFCWNNFERGSRFENRLIFEDASKPFDERRNAFIEMIKAYFSRSLESFDYDFSHPDFRQYISLFLYSQKQYSKNDVYKSLVKEYGTKRGMEGTYWKQPLTMPETKKKPVAKTSRSKPGITLNDFTYAMYNESQELTEENKQKLLEMARFFKEQQDKEKSKK